jgi:hypothetical protein
MEKRYQLVLERDINQIVSLDSSKRPPNSKVGNFIFDQVSQFNGVNRLGIRDYLLNADILIINKYNQSFTVNNQTVTIATGYYNTEQELGAAIQSALNANGGVNGLLWTVAYDNIQKRYTITNSTNIPLLFTVPTPCKNTTGLITSSLYPYVSARPTLIYTTYIDIISSRLSSYSRSDEFLDGKFNIIDRVYIGRGDYISFFGWGEYKNIKYFRFPSSANLGYIDIQLRDEYGNILNVGENVGEQFRFVMTLLCKQDLEESNNN